MNRRTFLHTSAAAGTLAALPFAVKTRAAEKSGRRFRTALVGCGWWGGNILGEAMASGACEIVGLCDVDARQFAAKVGQVAQGTGDQPRKYRDYRELLEKEKPEIVIVATPDHWHALPTIAAVKAGAHVYVEKPIAHTIAEGRAMVNAARAANRVVQVGTHRRTSPHTIQARELIRSGKAGEIGMIRCFVNTSGGGPEKPLPTMPVPPELDWDGWCGPAPLRPFNGTADHRGIHPRGFRQYLDYANGTLGDWGIHWFDQVLWITGEQAPRRVFAAGGRPVKGPPVLTPNEQTTDAPDHQAATFEFEKFTMTWESRQFAGHTGEKGDNAGANFYGTKGVFQVGWRGGWTFFPANPGEPVLHEAAKLNQPDGQNIRELWADFLEAIRTGRRPVSDIEAGHLSTNCSLLAVLSMKVGRSLNWNAAKETITGDPEANKLLRRAYRKGWEYPG
ncbi:MAG: Gfo/Idh/MocA family oxidoreductase [Verrucomicrobia bacterium]|nr:Gfo/Idh/MocA family oxidoreductase [Verrucomicrobiota bacterium]